MRDGLQVMGLAEAYVAACVLNGRPAQPSPAQPRFGGFPRDFAELSRAKALLEREAKPALGEMCASSWAFQSRQTEGMAE